MSATLERVGTTALHVESVGAGPPLVLLHGWGLHGGLFAPLLPSLARRFRVHVVDLPGHGHSPRDGGATLDALVASVSQAVAHEREPLAMLGWSLGGLVAMRWAQLERARIARMVLVATSPRFVAAPGWPHGMAPETLARFGDEFSASWKLTMQRFLALQVHGSEEGRATLAALRHQLFARGEPARDALADTLRILGSADLRDEVSALDAPALVVAGDRDVIAPAGAAAWLAAALPQGGLAVIDGAAHAPFLSHRAAFDAAVNAFLDG